MGTLQDALRAKGLADNTPRKVEEPLWKSPLQVLRQGEYDLNESSFSNILHDLDSPDRAKRSNRPTTWSKLDDERLQLVFKKTCVAEQAEGCKKLYRHLSKRTELLASSLDDKKDKALVTIKFPGRLRVGGPRGFRERLLPAFHPVYGIPYIPSSSLKGVLRAWAKTYLPDSEKLKVDNLLGYLRKDAEGRDEASLGKVQILDAFPTAPCLSVDVATPQWSWQGDRVEYGPSPHVMLSLENVTLKIGLARTSLGTASDVNTVLKWLKDALIVQGLGSRISAGYGQAQSNSPLNYPQKANQRPRSKHPFSLWSQGIYGVDQSEHELRPTALRGMLRYWFRAVGLGLYSPADCKRLEGELFGTIEPTPEQLKSKQSPPQGSFHTAITPAKVDVKQNPLKDSPSKKASVPYHDQPTAVLSAKTADHLNLLQHLFKLAVHCGGIGRGSRRPLHINDQRFRGCHWEALNQDETLAWSVDQWQRFLSSLLHAFPNAQNDNHSGKIDNPGAGKPRYHDVLNKNATILLVPCPKLIHPKNVKWKNQGSQRDVLGESLHTLYTRQDGSHNYLYKGEKVVDRRKGTTEGNFRVGGKLGIPSYVSIQSNFPTQAPPYQTVIVFGSAYHPDRQAFCADLLQNSGARKVIWPA